MFGMKQDTLALELGESWNQKKVSILESKEIVEPAILEQVAKILKVTPEAIRNCYEEMAVNIIANTITNHDQGAVINYNPTFNPMEKIVQLYDEKIQLYERMLTEKNELIEKLLRASKK